MATSKPKSYIEPDHFESLFAEELPHLGPNANPKNLVGLCFSGGGIRSATFNLGILAVLEKRRIIERVDYLSNVSGGGYLGAYFLGCRARGKSAGEENESGLNHLRRFGNYLALDNGFFSLDTWTGIMVWVRNTTLLQTFLLSVFAAVLLLPRLWAALAWAAIPPDPRKPDWFSWVPWFGVGEILGLALLAAVTWGICFLLSKDWRLPGASKGLWIVVVLGILAGIPLSVTLYKVVNLGILDPAFHARSRFAFGFGLTLAAAAWFFTKFSLQSVRQHGVRQGKSRVPKEKGDWLVPWVAAAAAGCAMFGLTYIAYAALGNWAVEIYQLKCFLTGPNNKNDAFSSGPWHFMLWAIPGMLAALSMSLTAMLGAAGRALPDLVRERWARLAACLMLACLGFTAIGTAGIYAPLLIWYVAGSETIWAKWISAAGGVGAVASGLIGLIFARGSGTKGKAADQAQKSSGTKEALAQLAPYFFVLLIVTGLSFGMNAYFAHGILNSSQQFAFAKFAPSDTTIFSPPGLVKQWNYHLLPGTGWPDARTLVTLHWTFLGITTDSIAGVAMLFAGLLAVAAFLAWRVDINSFSMNPFYRNRLVRCFLGASRYESEKRNAKSLRKPDPITGFDLDDDIQMLDLAKVIDTQNGVPHHDHHHKTTLPPDFIGSKKLPIPIINTALNAVGGQDAVQGERRADSFFFTPFHVYSDKTGGCALTEYSLGEKSGDVYLGTLTATSGAAANPNMGFHTSAPIAFLLTFFNVRLGWWVRNPKYGLQKGSPFGLLYTFLELTGTANDTDPRLNLSDGGHFENLGLYELIRRKCRYIIVGDAEQDGDYAFGSLGSAVRRCRDDFGADIRIDVSPIRPGKKGANCGHHYVRGTVTYIDRETDETSFGDILYLKSSYTGKEPLYDLHQYKLEHPDFPHESTADQFFSESQFESYRQLGKLAAEEALADQVWSMLTRRVFQQDDE